MVNRKKWAIPIWKALRRGEENEMKSLRTHWKFSQTEDTTIHSHTEPYTITEPTVLTNFLFQTISGSLTLTSIIDAILNGNKRNEKKYFNANSIHVSSSVYLLLFFCFSPSKNAVFFHSPRGIVFVTPLATPSTPISPRQRHRHQQQHKRDRCGVRTGEYKMKIILITNYHQKPKNKKKKQPNCFPRIKFSESEEHKYSTQTLLLVVVW